MFDFSFNKKRKFTARFLPEVIYAIFYGDKLANFDLKNILITGNFIFTNKETVLITFEDKKYEGLSFGRAIVVGGDWEVQKNNSS